MYLIIKGLSDNVAMYICLCNSINDRQVKSAVEAGAQAWLDVHELYGCEPKCGQCRVEIVEAIVDHRINQGKRDNMLVTSNVLSAAE